VGIVVTGLAFTVVPLTAQAAEVDLRTTMQGSATYTRATGHSEYDRSREGRDVEVTVRNIGRLAGKNVTVYVSGTKVGSMLVGASGVAHREWDTERGQSVPVASVGDYIRVRTASGTLVAYGKYHRQAD
jgi:hypothetical protein